jgi:hypothetical protein
MMLKCLLRTRRVEVVIVDISAILVDTALLEIREPNIKYFISSLIVHSDCRSVLVSNENIRWLEIEISLWLIALGFKGNVREKHARKRYISEIIYSRIPYSKC